MGDGVAGFGDGARRREADEGLLGGLSLEGGRQTGSHEAGGDVGLVGPFGLAGLEGSSGAEERAPAPGDAFGRQEDESLPGAVPQWSMEAVLGVSGGFGLHHSIGHDELDSGAAGGRGGEAERESAGLAWGADSAAGIGVGDGGYGDGILPPVASPVGLGGGSPQEALGGFPLAFGALGGGTGLGPDSGMDWSGPSLGLGLGPATLADDVDMPTTPAASRPPSPSGSAGEADASHRGVSWGSE